MIMMWFEVGKVFIRPICDLPWICDLAALLNCAVATGMA
jgi:hypothetical protein